MASLNNDLWSMINQAITEQQSTPKSISSENDPIPATPAPTPVSPIISGSDRPLLGVAILMIALVLIYPEAKKVFNEFKLMINEPLITQPIHNSTTSNSNFYLKNPTPTPNQTYLNQYNINNPTKYQIETNNTPASTQGEITFVTPTVVKIAEAYGGEIMHFDINSDTIITDGRNPTTLIVGKPVFIEYEGDHPSTALRIWVQQ